MQADYSLKGFIDKKGKDRRLTFFIKQVIVSILFIIFIFTEIFLISLSGFNLLAFPFIALHFTIIFGYIYLKIILGLRRLNDLGKESSKKNYIIFYILSYTGIFGYVLVFIGLPIQVYFLTTALSTVGITISLYYLIVFLFVKSNVKNSNELKENDNSKLNFNEKEL